MSILEHLIENYIHEMGKGKRPKEIAEVPYIKEQLAISNMSADDMWEIAQHVVYSLYDGLFPDFDDLPEGVRKLYD